MDGLSASSVFAVVSLPMQLATSAKQLFEFWDSVVGAPKAIENIAIELKLLSIVLDQIEARYRKRGLSGTTLNVLNNCTNQVEEMITITTDFEKGFSSSRWRSRKWASVKVSFEGQRINRFQSLLEHTKTTLMLASQNSIEQQIDCYFERQWQKLESLDIAIRQIKLPQPSRLLTIPGYPGVIDHAQASQAGAHGRINPVIPDNFQHEESHFGPHIASSRGSMFPQLGFQDERLLARNMIQIRTSRMNISCLFGTIMFNSRIKTALRNSREPYDNDCSAREEREISVSIRPTDWILRMGLGQEFRLDFSQSCHDWKQTIQTFQPVADDSTIFQYCKTGDVDGIRLLLSTGQASVRDIDSLGQTPLHIAAKSTEADVCRLLLWKGASPNVRTHSGYGCLRLACSYTDSREENKVIETIRLFLPQADVIDECGPGWEALGLLGLNLLSGENSALRWMIQVLHSDIPRQAREKGFHRVLCEVAHQKPSIYFEEALDVFHELIDGGRREHRGYPALHTCLVWGRYREVRDLVQKGVDLHLVGLCSYYSPTKATPTSLALYSSESFFEWRKILTTESIDLADFIRKELRQTPLNDAGWEEDTLMALFQLFQLDSKPGWELTGSWCIGYHPTMGFDRSIVEVRWQRLLNRIKDRKGLRSDLDDYLRPSKLRSLPAGREIHSQLHDGAVKSSSVHRDEGIVVDYYHPNSGNDGHIKAESEDGDLTLVCPSCWHMTLSERDREYGIAEEDIASDDESSPFLFDICHVR